MTTNRIGPVNGFFGLAIVACTSLSFAEIPEVDPTAEGPWSDVERTTLTVPLIPDGSVVIDGSVSQEEYGNFPGQFVNPGENAFILDFPGDRQWDDENDSSFTFWLAHDTNYFYVGINAKDDVLNQDDDTALWKDDSVEMIVDALNDRYDINTDASNDPYGGHNYVSYNGKFSDWNHADNERLNMRWTSAIEWTYAEDGEVWSVGSEVDGGWQLDVRFAKSLFEDPEAGNKLEDGYVMGFNIGLDDDDKFGGGPNGDGTREQDLELQYWWANRLRAIGWTPEEEEGGAKIEDFDLGINSGGRLTHGGTGEIIFSNENPFELSPGPNISISARKSLGQLDSAPPSYAEVLSVRNSGTENTLAISAVTVTGPDAALFSVDAFPATIAPQESADIRYTFTPNRSIGDFSVTFEIVNDDVDADDQTRFVEVTASVVNLQGPIAHYSLDEAAGTTEMLDITGFHRHGTFENAITLGKPALATGTAMIVAEGGFGQVDGRQLPIENFTVSMWIQANVAAGLQTFFAQGEQGGNPTYALLTNDGDLQWFVGDAPVFATSTGAAYTAGTTHHIALSHTADSGTVAIYVDGVEVASQTGLDPLVIDSSVTTFMIGSFNGALPFNGIVDDVQVYDRALSVENITFLKNNPGEVLGVTGPVDGAIGALIAHWNFEGDVQDQAGSNHGALVGGATLAASFDGMGQALSLDGIDDYVSTTDIDVEFITIAAWVSAIGGEENQGFVINKNYDGDTVPYSLNIGGNNSADALDGLGWFTRGWKNSDLGEGGDLRGTGWHHVAGSYDGTTLKYFVDGELLSSSEEGSGPLPQNDEVLDIGRYLNDEDYFGGLIDDLRIYNIAIADADIKALYDASPKPSAPTASIVWSTPNPNTSTADLIGGPEITFSPFMYDGGNADGTFFTGDGGTTGDDNLDAVYNSHGWNGDGATITLDGLTAGQSYQVQLLGAGDTRSCCDTRNQAASDGTNVSDDFGRGNSSVVGSFTAAGSTQGIDIVAGTDNGVDPGLSGIILVDADGKVLSAHNIGRSEGDDVTVTVPPEGSGDPVIDMLVLGADDAGEAGADANVLAFLRDTFGADNVRYLNSGATDGSETADVIVMSSTFGSGSVRGKFHNSAVPVVNWEEAVMDAGDGEFGQSLATMTKSTDTFQMALSNHPIAGDLAGTTIDFFTEVGAETLGSSEVSAGTDVVGTASGGSIDSLAMLFVTDAGGAVADTAGIAGNVSPARRVALPMTDVSFDSLSEAGKEIFANSIRWAAGVLGGGGNGALIAHFPLDSDGNSANGAFTASTVTDVEFTGSGANGNTGGSAVFNGSSSLIQHDWSADLNPESFTLALWAKSEGGAGAWNSPVTSRHDLNPDSQGYLIYDNQPDGNWTFWSGNGTAEGNWQVLDGPAATLGEWEHVAITYDNTTETKRLYINGVLAVEAADSITPNDTTPFNIGAGEDTGTGFHFAGEIDDIGLWDIALTDSQIKVAMNNGVAAALAGGGGGNLDEVPEITGVSISADGVALQLPVGTTYDIEYSADLVTWEVIASDVTGSYSDGDAGRASGATGYYRGIVK